MTEWIGLLGLQGQPKSISSFDLGVKTGDGLGPTLGKYYRIGNLEILNDTIQEELILVADIRLSQCQLVGSSSFLNAGKFVLALLQ